MKKNKIFFLVGILLLICFSYRVYTVNKDAVNLRDFKEIKINKWENAYGYKFRIVSLKNGKVEDDQSEKPDEANGKIEIIAQIKTTDDYVGINSSLMTDGYLMHGGSDFLLFNKKQHLYKSVIVYDGKKKLSSNDKVLIYSFKKDQKHSFIINLNEENLNKR